MGAQWKQAGREANAMKRGQIIGKLVREIIIAAKLGGADPDLNARLTAAIEKARKNSVPRDTIDRAVKRGSGTGEDAAQFELVTYEGFTPEKVPVIVECLTDNRNRTAPEIRHLFRVGSLGAPGAWRSSSSTWVWSRPCTRIPAGMRSRMESNPGRRISSRLRPARFPAGQVGARFYTDSKDLGAVSKWLAQAKWRIVTSELRYEARNPMELDEARRKVVVDFLNALDDHDDVHRVYAALK